MECFKVGGMMRCRRLDGCEQSGFLQCRSTFSLFSGAEASVLVARAGVDAMRPSPETTECMHTERWHTKTTSARNSSERLKERVRERVRRTASLARAWRRLRERGALPHGEPRRAPRRSKEKAEAA
eukprot:430392-Pleurochrysis_carterae.AAC.5